MLHFDFKSSCFKGTAAHLFQIEYVEYFRICFYYVLYVKSAIQAPYLLFCLDMIFNAQQ